jgi:hypothetical protein
MPGSAVSLNQEKNQDENTEKEDRTMLRHHGGDRVGKGTYWNLTNGERVDIETEGILPGAKKRAFYRMPAAAIIIAAPVIGLAYAAFLPFIGIAMLVKLVAVKVGGGARDMVLGKAHFGFRPSESYLAGKKRKAEKGKDENEDET